MPVTDSCLDKGKSHTCILRCYRTFHPYSAVARLRLMIFDLKRIEPNHPIGPRVANIKWFKCFPASSALSSYIHFWWSIWQTIWPHV